MAGASDKARFYLEKAVPELQELRRKNIFTRQEVSSIVKTRSDFEHKLNARGSDPADYAKYAAYEMNLESLRRKRTKKLGVKITKHSGQRRIFFLLERATRKFHGDIGLWMQYVSFARKQKSNKKILEILSHMVRLFPTKPEIWIYAANYAMEERGDMTEARSYMQKGLRFCKRSKELWIEYARLEMIYIAKLAARRKILGLDQSQDRREQNIEDGNEDGDEDGDEDGNEDGNEDDDEDVNGEPMHLTQGIAKNVNPFEKQDERPSQKALGKVDFTSATSGGIPIAVFNAAMKEFKNDNDLSWNFFDIIAEFDVAPRRSILGHIIHVMQATAPNEFGTLTRFVQQPIIGLDPRALEFPMSLATSLDRLEAASQRSENTQSREMLYQNVADWVAKLLEVDDLDIDIRKVLQAILKKTQDQS